MESESEPEESAAKRSCKWQRLTLEIEDKERELKAEVKKN